MEKEKKKKRKLKIRLLPLFIAIIILSCIVIGLYYFSLVPIHNIYIKGNTYLTDQEIIEISKLSNYPSFLKTRTSYIKKNLKKNSYVKQVKVTKKLKAEVHIEVEEEKLLFRKEESGLLVLENKKEIEDGKKYQVPILLNYVPDTKYDYFIKEMANIDSSIHTFISEIRYYPNEQDDDRFLLYMNDGNSVYLTLTKFKQINYYEEVLEQLEGKKGILYLDSGNHFQVMEE